MVAPGGLSGPSGGGRRRERCRAPGPTSLGSLRAMSREDVDQRPPAVPTPGWLTAGRAVAQTGSIATLGADAGHQERQLRRDGADRGQLLRRRRPDHQADGATRCAAGPAATRSGGGAPARPRRRPGASFEGPEPRRPPGSRSGTGGRRSRSGRSRSGAMASAPRYGLAVTASAPRGVESEWPRRARRGGDISALGVHDDREVGRDPRAAGAVELDVAAVEPPRPSDRQPGPLAHQPVTDQAVDRGAEEPAPRPDSSRGPTPLDATGRARERRTQPGAQAAVHAPAMPRWTPSRPRPRAGPGAGRGPGRPTPGGCRGRSGPPARQRPRTAGTARRARAARAVVAVMPTRTSQ